MSLLNRLWAYPTGRLGLALVALVLAFGLLGPWLSPYDPVVITVPDRFAVPSWQHPLGTDQIGRDLATRLAYGTRLALVLAVIVLALALASGVTLGILAAFAPRRPAQAILVGFDMLAAFPSVILALAIFAALGPGLDRLTLIIAATMMPHFGRVARAQALGFRGSPFIEAERALGASAPRILVLHVLPNMLGALIVLASLDLPVVITIEAGLSFLGLGVPPPQPSLGNLLNDGYSTIGRTLWPVAGAAGILALATLGFTLFGEALRDALDRRSAP
ncbi:MAG TPA: ABC transporter permease [Aliidongia sp.]|nr:ABC transporter permease [Aliidongia sp.]